MTTSQIRCLLAVLALSDTFERVESKNVAHLLGVKRPTIHNSLELLQNKGLIDKALYGAVKLTSSGLALARKLETRRDDIAMMLCKQYGLSPEEGAKAALALISELTEESLDKLTCHTISSDVLQDEVIRDAIATSERVVMTTGVLHSAERTNDHV